MIGAVLALTGSGFSFAGFGHDSICVTQPNTGYSGSGWTDHLDVAARPGATISINGTLSACAAHPGIGQRTLYSLTILPGLLVWGCVLFLLWRVIAAARRTGPFTVQVAVAMRRLGWLIIAGSVVAGVVQRLALYTLLNSMLATQDGGAFAVAGVIVAGLQALLPVPALAGAALLTLARIIRLGAGMDDELQATV